MNRLPTRNMAACPVTHPLSRPHTLLRTLLASALLCAGQAMAAAPLVTTQLPRTVRPEHYQVSITPDAAKARFSARVAISITVLQSTASMTLNAAELDFSSVQLLAMDSDKVLATARVTLDSGKQTATFRFPQAVMPGKYRLALAYTGVIGTQSSGLFSLDYAGATGPQRALYTQFENSDARRMIASWDEPAYKATFSLEAIVPADQMAVSNMPVRTSTLRPDGRRVVQFARSPKMSTYLLFFGLGDFERATTQVDGTELGVVTKKGVLAQAQFSLDASAVILREYNDYFGTPYPLPKLDNIAAPGRSQFFGAMENWGAIFTFEHVMLLDPAVSTQNDKQRVFSIAAHEMAHQWFGDLVTMAWWDDLWLNEGFASWMESRTTMRLHPEWRTALGVIDDRERAMNLDSLTTTHPVVQHIATVEQASQAFDAITYSKGEAVIRMLENHVGETAWRDGVRAYMKQHAYRNTVSDDLWREIEQSAGQPVTAIAHDFTLQAGIPLIRVEQVACKDGESTVQLTQGEFSRSQPNKKSLLWRVPVTLQSGTTGALTRTLVSGGKASVKVPGCEPVLVNAGQAGYYRTLYAPREFARLAGSFGTLKPVDQLGVLADSAQLGLAGLQPMADFLGLAGATPLSAEPRVWSAIASQFVELHRYYEGDRAGQQRFARFAIARLAPVMAQLGWEARAGESEAIAPEREKLVNALSALGDPVTIAEAHRRVSEAAMPSAALRKLTLSVQADHADLASWNAMLQSARDASSSLVKQQLYDLLATSQDASLAQRALDLALTDEPGLTTSAGMIRRVADDHPDLAFDFALAHLERTSALIDSSSSSRYFPGLASNSADPAMRDKLLAYADAHLNSDARRDVNTARARIADRIRIRTSQLAAVDAWLAMQR